MFEQELILKNINKNLWTCAAVRNILSAYLEFFLVLPVTFAITSTKCSQVFYLLTFRWY